MAEIEKRFFPALDKERSAKEREQETQEETGRRIFRESIERVGTNTNTERRVNENSI